MGAATIMEDKCTSAAATAAPSGEASAACSRVGGSSSSRAGSDSHQSGQIAASAAAPVTGAAAASAAAACRSPVTAAAAAVASAGLQQPCCAATAGGSAATCLCRGAGRGLPEAVEGAAAGASSSDQGSPDSFVAATASDGMDANVDAADDGEEQEVEEQQQRWQQQLLLKLQRHPLFRDLQAALLQECLAAPRLPSALLCALPDDVTAADIGAVGIGAGDCSGRRRRRQLAATAPRRQQYETVSRAVVGTHVRVERDIASLRPWTNRAGLVLERSYRSAVAAAECQRYAALLYNCHSEECKRRINAYYDCERLLLVQRVQQRLAQRSRDIGLTPAYAATSVSATAAPAMEATCDIDASEFDSECDQVQLCKPTNAGSKEVAAAAGPAASGSAASGSAASGSAVSGPAASESAASESAASGSAASGSTASGSAVSGPAASGSAAAGRAAAATESGVTESGTFAVTDSFHDCQVSDGSNLVANSALDAATATTSAPACADPPVHARSPLQSSTCNTNSPARSALSAAATSAASSAAAASLCGEEGSHTRTTGRDHRRRWPRAAEASPRAQRPQQPSLSDLPLDLSCRLGSASGCADSSSVALVVAGRPATAGPRPRFGDSSGCCHVGGGIANADRGRPDDRDNFAGDNVCEEEEAAAVAAAVPALWEVPSSANTSGTYQTSARARPASSRGGGVKKRMLSKYSWESLSFVEDSLADAAAADSRCYDTSSWTCNRVKPIPLAAATHASSSAFARSNHAPPAGAATAAEATAAARLGRNRASLDDVVAQCLSSQKQRKRRAASVQPQQQQQACQRRKGASNCWVVKAGPCTAGGSVGAQATPGTAAGSTGSDATAATLGTSGRLPALLLNAVKLEPSVPAAFSAAGDYMHLVSGWSTHDVGALGAGASTSVLESLKRVVNSVAAMPADDEKAGSGRWQPSSVAQLRTNSSTTSAAAASGGCEAAAARLPITSGSADIVGCHVPLLVAPLRATEIGPAMSATSTVAAAPVVTAGAAVAAGMCVSHTGGGRGSGPHQPPAGKRYLSHHARLVLNDWFLKHIRRPYPTLSEKILLAQQCGISSAKVDTWFANKRNRTHNTRKLLPKYSRLVLLKSAAAATAASASGIAGAPQPSQVQPTALPPT